MILGARAKARRLPNEATEQARKARERLAELGSARGQSREMDMAAAKEVKHLGLIANYDE